MQTNPRFDDLLFTIVKESGGLEGLLHSVFSFLFRRTDFFYESDPGDKMGFPPGYTPRMLLNMLDLYQQEHYKKYPKKDPAEYQAKLKKLQEAAKQQKAQEEVKVPETQAKKTDAPETKKSDPIQEEKTTTKTTTAQQSTNKIEEEDSGSFNKPSTLDAKARAISTYNGAETEKYNWSQGLNELTVQIPIPAGTRAKQLQVDITSTNLKVVLKTTGQVLLEGAWYERVKADDSTWSVDEDSLILNIEKGNENIWKSVLKGDKEIDATKVDNSKPIDAFDHETQGALRKIVYEQQRKQMGLPTTEEEAQQELLKKAWNAEGSPFKGQPFDPTKFNLSGGNQMNFGPQ